MSVDIIRDNFEGCLQSMVEIAHEVDVASYEGEFNHFKLARENLRARMRRCSRSA